jgi:HK97 family phage prohead protease
MHKKLSLDFQAKAKGDVLMIEGFANRAIVDRGGDLVDPKGMDLKNFMKNPILLFNHNPDFPIGKVTDIQASDEGLFVRAQISSSKADKITGVRDLVREGALKSFSIGFSSNDEEKNEEGVNVIKSGELLELSVVGIPMNQDSQFRVISKKLKSMNVGERNKVAKEAHASGHEVDEILQANIKSLNNQVVQELWEILRMDAEKPALGMAIKEKLFEKDMTQTQLAEAVGVTKSAISQIISGTTANPKDATLEKIEAALGFERGTLKGMDKEEEEKGDEKLEGSEFQDCVRGKIPVLMREGKERDEAVAQAVAMCREKSECAAPSDEQMKEYMEFAASCEDDKGSDYKEDEEEKGSDYKEDEKEEKQADQGVDQPATSELEGADMRELDENPQLMAAKQANVLLAQLVGAMQELKGTMEKLAGVMVGENAKEEASEDDYEMEEAAEEMAEQQAMEDKMPEQQEDSEEEAAEQEPKEDKSKQSLDRIKKYQDDIKSILKSISR